MCNLLTLVSQPAQSPTLWDTVFLILAALIGGGIVTLIFDLIRSSRRAMKIRRLFKADIKMNLDLMESETIQKNPWMTHKIWSGFYDANSIDVISFKGQNTAAKIIRFYAILETLRLRQEEDKEVEILNKEGKYDAAEMVRKGIGATKHALRADMIPLAKEIIKS
jgi:hypothetical protein